MRHTDGLQFDYDEEWQVLSEKAQKVHVDRPTKLDWAWLAERRSVQVAIRKMLEERRRKEEWRDLELLASSQGMQEKYGETLLTGMAWSDFALEGLERAIELRDRRADVEVEPVTDAPTAESHVVTGARDRYMQFFNRAAGRRMTDGPPGIDADRPEVPQSDGFDDAAWARFFLALGGYGSAGQVDEHGWTALMHAVGATVHWDLAWRCAIGLMNMMSDVCLRRKAVGGRMKGYTALHICCNNSDRAFKKAHLATLLIGRGVDLEATNDKGLTPWLMAAGTGVVDVAMALSQAGCNITATTPEGQNVVDRCAGSSTQMRCFVESLGLLKTELRASNRWRQPDDISSSRAARYAERGMQGPRSGGPSASSQAASSHAQHWWQQAWWDEPENKRRSAGWWHSSDDRWER